MVAGLRDYEYQSDFARSYYAEGMAASVIAVLQSRGITVSDDARGRIKDCGKREQHLVWLQRALTVRTAGELFGFPEDWAAVRREAYASGFAQGQAETLLNVLDARGLELSDETRARISDCLDPVCFTLWAQRAVTAETADDLFG